MFTIQKIIKWHYPVLNPKTLLSPMLSGLPTKVEKKKKKENFKENPLEILVIHSDSIVTNP